MPGETKTTINHDVIRGWAEKRSGKPVAIIEGKNIIGSINIDLPEHYDRGEEIMEEISWDEWFEKFDREKDALLYQDETYQGEMSNFHAFVKRLEGNLRDLTQAQTTIDHGKIKEWADRRGAVPASIKGTEDEGEVAGILTFDFAGDPNLEILNWDEFFKKFEKEKLAFTYRELESNGDYSHWYEFDNRV